MRSLIAVVLLGWAAAGTAAAADARELAGRALELARAGSTAQAVELYRQALAESPEATDIRLDYATALGWGEQYDESIRQFERARNQQPDLPDWALREMARAELFGGHPERALPILDALLEAGDQTEVTQCRKGLALRWLHRPAEAERVYREVRLEYPGSTAAVQGLIYSLAEQERMERAVAMAEAAVAGDPHNWELLKTYGQVLNWMGRHRAALRVLESIPADHQNDREMLESRLAAARWGGEPGQAKSAARLLADRWPDDPGVQRVRRELSLDYGIAIEPSFRFSSDSDGFSERLLEQDFVLHAGAANRLQFGVGQRQFSQDQNLGWRRYDVSWSGSLSRSWSAYASAADVQYTSGAPHQQFLGDMALTYAAGDRLRFTAGGGTLAMDAFRAVENRVTGRFAYFETSAEPWSGLTLDSQFAQYRFSDDVVRNSVRMEALRRVRQGRRLRLDLGGAGNFLWNDRPTDDFYSPSSFHSLLGEAQASGHLSSRLEYSTQFGAGAQSEAGYPVQSPLIGTGTLFVRLSPRLMLRLDGGRSTSSLERINPGRPSYSRSVAAVSLVFRFE